MSFSHTFDSSNDGACQQSSYVYTDESRSVLSCGTSFAPARALDRQLEALSFASYKCAESGINQNSSVLEFHTCEQSPKASSILQVNQVSSLKVNIESFKPNNQLEKCLSRRFVGRDVSDELEVDRIKRKLQSNLDVGEAKLVLYRATIRQLEVSVNFMEINPITSGYGVRLTEFKLKNSKLRLGKLLTAVLMIKDNLDSLKQTLRLMEGREAVMTQPVSTKFVLLKSIYDVYDKLC